MSRRRLRALAVLTAASISMSACVTNVEEVHPEGWTPIVQDAVPEIAAMVPESVAADGVLAGGTNPPFAPFELKDSDGEIVGIPNDIETLGLYYNADIFNELGVDRPENLGDLIDACGTISAAGSRAR